MCRTMDEAEDVLRLKDFIASIEQSEVESMVKLVSESPLVKTILKDIDTFYPVAYGIHDTAIYQDWYVSSIAMISFWLTY
jgi:hypothetical protein